MAVITWLIKFATLYYAQIIDDMAASTSESSNWDGR